MGQRGGAGDSLHGHSPSARPETQAQQGEWALGVHNKSTEPIPSSSQALGLIVLASRPNDF